MAGQGSSTPLVTAEALTEGLEKLQDGLLNTEIPTEEHSSFLKGPNWLSGQPWLCREAFKKGFRGVYVPTLLAPQAAVALHRVSIAFQGRQMGKVLRTDAKPVYCVYYASGVTYLNPCASQQGNAPHATLLVDSHPFNSLLKIQPTAVAAVPWNSRGVLPSHVEPDVQLGSGRVMQGMPGTAGSSAAGIHSFLREHRQGHTPAGGSTSNTALQLGYSGVPWGA